MLILLSLLALQVDTASLPPQTAPAITTASGLRFETLVPGTGRRPQPGDAVLVTYEGRLADGTVFDSTAQPVGLPVSNLVPGFTEALLLMNEGGRYRFWIPPARAYGAEGAPGVVPPNAELDFTVTLIRVGHAARP
jgi:FKBP-type peptidyl-prolyl cis-trans isomerase FkpA